MGSGGPPGAKTVVGGASPSSSATIGVMTYEGSGWPTTVDIASASSGENARAVDAMHNENIERAIDKLNTRMIEVTWDRMRPPCARTQCARIVHPDEGAIVRCIRRSSWTAA